MTDHDVARAAFLTEVRRQLRHSRTLDAAVCGAFETLSVSAQAAYARALTFAGCGTARVPDADVEVTADARVEAAELMLLTFAADTGDPAWSSYLLERFTHDVLQTPGGQVEDLFRAAAAVFGDFDVPLTDVVAAFVDDLVVLAFTRYRRSYDSSSFEWLTQDLLTQPSPAVAFLGLRVLPPEQSAEIRAAIISALGNSRYAEDAARQLAD